MHAVGGTERVVFTLADEWQKRGYEVEILSVFGTISPFESGTIRTQSFNPKTVITFSERLTALFKMHRYLRSNRPDIIYSTFGYLNIFSAVTLPMFSRIGCDHTTYDNSTLKFAIVRKLVYRFLDAVVVLTHKDKERYNTLNTRVDVIYNPLSETVPKEYQKSSWPKTLLAVGRLEEVKGFDRLIKAFAMIRTKHNDWKLKIYGEGSLHETLNALAIQLDVSNAIDFMGHSSDIHTIYADASICCLSSYLEGFSMVLIEAKMFGLPIVAFDCPYGPSEIIQNGIDGILVEDGDIKRYADTLDRIINDHHLRESMSQAAIKDTERFRKESVMEQWDNLFQRIHFNEQ
jgi:glycosyltransferase involved in cell wall biosynthesis